MPCKRCPPQRGRTRVNSLRVATEMYGRKIKCPNVWTFLSRVSGFISETLALFFAEAKEKRPNVPKRK